MLCFLYEPRIHRIKYNKTYFHCHLRDRPNDLRPNALCAFNSGTASFVSETGDDTPIKWYENETFTCGEDNDFTYVFHNRFTDGAQNHLLIPMGEYRGGNVSAGWRNTGVRRSKEYMADYIRQNNAVGAVITVDVFVDCHGNLDPEQVEALCYIGQHV